MKRRSHLIFCVIGGLVGAACMSARADDVADPLGHSGRMLELHPNATYDPEAILVRFAPSATLAQRDTIRALVGGTKLQEWTLVPDLEQVKVIGDVKAAIATLNATPGVMYAELDWFVHSSLTPNDPSFGLLWGLNNTGQTVNGDPGSANADINGPEAWNVTTGSSTFVIADIDSGVNYNHPDPRGEHLVQPRGGRRRDRQRRERVHRRHPRVELRLQHQQPHGRQRARGRTPPARSAAWGTTGWASRA